MQKRGVARADQAVMFVRNWLPKESVTKLTKCNNVAEGTEHAKVERAVLDLLTTSHERNEDGGSVTQGQANDTDTGESVESSGSTEVDETESDLNNHTQHHGVERNIEVRVDSPPQLVAGNSTVTREGPGSSGGSGGAPDTTEETEDQQRNEQTNGTTGGAYSIPDDNRCRLAGK